MSDQPRHIRTDASVRGGQPRKIRRTDGAASSARPAGGYSAGNGASSARSGYSAQNGASAARGGYSGQNGYASGSGSSARGGYSSGGRAAAPRRKKKKRTPVWVPLLVVLCLISTAAGAVLGYVRSVFDAITPDSGAATIAQEVKTAPEYSGDVVGILVCGIDYEEGRSYGTSGDGQSNDGMTDMILYFQFDVKNNKINMLQIPRNTLVGASVTGATGKSYKASNYQINSIMKSNDDGMAALADVIANNYKLPVDYYATIDMDALKELVNRFGGLDVYIPQRISYGGSTLEAGYHRLLGDQVEFFVRNRKGSGYANSDLDRLNMQRYFYSALFKKMRTLTLADIVKLLPVVTYFVKTDIPADDCVALAYKFLSVDSTDIMVCQTPMYAGDEYNGNSILVPDRAGIADLLNTYFRTYTDPVDASSLNLADNLVNTRGEASSANVQFMGQLDTQADTAIANGDTDLAASSAA